MSSPLTADGIVIRVVSYSDTSQILTFWTRDAGRLTGIAKGAKRTRSAFHGPFDLFGLYHVVYREKAAGQLALLTSADLIDPHAGTRAGPAALAAASYCAEILLGLTAEGMPIPSLFDLLHETLAGLGGAEDERRIWEPVLFRFEAQALTHLGHRPRLASCAVCGEHCGLRIANFGLANPQSAIRNPQFVRFSPRAGGAVCARCSEREEASLRVRADTLDVLDRLSEPRATAPEPPLAAPLRQELRALLRSQITYLLERPPVALAMLPP